MEKELPPRDTACREVRARMQSSKVHDILFVDPFEGVHSFLSPPSSDETFRCPPARLWMYGKPRVDIASRWLNLFGCVDV
jgi:hypothetical protein